MRQRPVLGDPAGHERVERGLHVGADPGVGDPPGDLRVGAADLLGRVEVDAAHQHGLVGVEQRVVERLVRARSRRRGAGGPRGPARRSSSPAASPTPRRRSRTAAPGSSSPRPCRGRCRRGRSGAGGGRCRARRAAGARSRRAASGGGPGTSRSSQVRWAAVPAGSRLSRRTAHRNQVTGEHGAGSSSRAQTRSRPDILASNRARSAAVSASMNSRPSSRGRR